MEIQTPNMHYTGYKIILVYYQNSLKIELKRYDKQSTFRYIPMNVIQQMWCGYQRTLSTSTHRIWTMVEWTRLVNKRKIRLATLGIQYWYNIEVYKVWKWKRRKNKKTVAHITINKTIKLIDATRFSKWTRLIRATAWALKFLNLTSKQRISWLLLHQGRIDSMSMIMNEYIN